MAYTAPPTFVAGDPLAADDLNTLGDDIVDLDARVQGTVASLVALTRSSNQSTATGVAESVVWTTEVIDVGGWWSSGAAIVVPASAIPDGATTIGVMVNAFATFALNATGSRIIRVLVNGSSARQRSQSADGGEATISEIMGKVVEVAAADEIEIEVEQSSGGSLNVTAAGIDLVRVGVIS